MPRRLGHSPSKLLFFAASGHIFHMKSVHNTYLQKMAKLPEQHPEIHQHFKESLHVIRRSDRCWSGLSPDLVIEQCLMRSLKTTGGLTRGSGFSETQRLLWVLSMPACVEINSPIQQLTNVKYSTSEQHKEVTYARVARDAKDTQEVLLYLSQRSPFTAETSLRNIETGVIAPPHVNVYEPKSIGKHILASMEGNPCVSYIFWKKNQAVIMDTKSTIKMQGEYVHVDPQLLFQRLLTIGTKNGELHNVFTHELCQYPPTLFESVNAIRPTTKSSLTDALWCSDAGKPGPSKTVKYVFDCGALLDHIPWTRGATYDQILEQYSAYVIRKYGRTIVVFYGYSDKPSTKVCAHMRSDGAIGVTVHLTSSMALQTKKEEFLFNRHNTQRLIALLSQRLEQTGCEIYQKIGDANVLIVH